MAIKPILVIRLPKFANDSQVSDTRRRIRDTKEYEKVTKDYHVFVVVGFTNKEIKFEVYNGDKIPDIQLEQLKQKLYESIDSITK